MWASSTCPLVSHFSDALVAALMKVWSAIPALLATTHLPFPFPVSQMKRIASMTYMDSTHLTFVEHEKCESR